MTNNKNIYLKQNEKLTLISDTRNLPSLLKEREKRENQ
jgi:hypothetical protein